MAKRLLTVSEAALMAGKNKAQISRLVKQGRIAAAARNATGHPLIDPAEVLRFYPGSDYDLVLQKDREGQGGPADDDAAPASTDVTISTMRIDALQAEVNRLNEALDRVTMDLNAERRARERDHEAAREEREQARQERLDLIALQNKAITDLPLMIEDQRTKREKELAEQMRQAERVKPTPWWRRLRKG